MLKAKIKQSRRDIFNSELRRRIRESDRRAVTVGFPANGSASSGTKDSSGKNRSYADIIEIAVINHFGTRDGRIPPRPFMDQAFQNEGRQRVRNTVTKELRVLMRPQSSGNVLPSLDRIGNVGVAVIRKAIRSRDYTPNAPATIERKGSDNPLVDTGQMAQSVQHTIIRDV